MPQHDVNWLNKNNLNIFAQIWQSDNDPTAVVCLVHGHGEHSSRYAHVAEAMNTAGYAVIALDLQGHGKSDGPRGDMPAYDALLDDIDQLLLETEQRFPNTPRFLYGHSMGGNLVLNHVLRRQPPLAGVIATSPWLRLAFTPPALLIYAMRFLNWLWPSASLASGLKTADISRDLAEVSIYKHDPLIHNRISARQLMQVDGAGQWALDHARDFSLPLLLVHGSADKITSADASRQFAAAVPTDCTFKLWDGLYHETHNEPEKQEVIAFTLNWIEKTMDS